MPDTSMNVFFAISPDLFCVVSKEGNFVTLNPACETVLGYSPHELEGTNFMENLHPDDIGPTLKKIEHQSREKAPISFAARNRCSDNTYKWLEWKGQTGADGSIFAVAREIGGNQSSERDIFTRKNNSERISGSCSDAIIMLNNMGKISFWNETASTIFGYTKSEIIGRSLDQLIAPAKRQLAHQEFPGIFEPSDQGEALEKKIEITAAHKNGHEFPVGIFLSVFKAENTWQTIGVIHDVTTRKVNEDAQENREQKFRQIFHNMQDVYVLTNIEGTILEVSPSVSRFLQYEREELLGTLVQNIYYDQNDRQDLLREAKEKGELLDYELRLRNKNNELVWASINNLNLLDGQGNLLGMESMVRDISFRKHAEDEMRKLSTAVEHSPVSIIISDLEGNIVYANPKAVETTGYSLEELLGQNPRVLKSGETDQQEYFKLWENISTGKQWSGTFHNKKKDGTLYWESSSISPIMDSTGRIINYVAVKEDITERKKINDDLIDSEAKLKAANQTKDKLFSIIGHDLRSSIGSFGPILELLTDEGNLDETEKSVLLNALLQGSRTAYNLLENLLSWASGQSGRINLEPAYFNIKEVINSNIDLLSSSSLQKSISLSVNSRENVSVFADRNSIDLVVRNLISNAIKFTRERGSITINLLDAGNFIEVEISDSGVGIKKEIAENLFASNSFYTTLGTNFEKGSGLGLVLCKDFVEKNGGSIRVESVVGKGSRFTFSIPRNEPES